MLSRFFVRTPLRSFCLAAILLAAAVFPGPRGFAEEPKPAPFDAAWRVETAAESKIRAALADTTQVEFIETPLNDVVDFFKDLHGIGIQFDRKSLDEVGISTDTPITRNLKNVSLRSALKLILRDLDLTFVVRNEVLEITTPGVVEVDRSVRPHAVADLVTDEASAKSLATVVEMALDPHAKNIDAEPGTKAGPRVVLFREVLLVRGNIHEHERVGDLLAHLRKVLELPAPKATPTPKTP